MLLDIELSRKLPPPFIQDFLSGRSIQVFVCVGELPLITANLENEITR